MTAARRLRALCGPLAIALLVIVTLLGGAATAHEIRPAYLQVDQIGPTRFKVTWRTPLLSGMRLPVVLQFSDRVRNVTEPAERTFPDSIVESRIVEAPGGLAGERITFTGLQATITDVLVRAKLTDGAMTTVLVHPSQPWVDVQPRAGALEVVKVFVGDGIQHILFGLDHLLFVAALMLIVRDWRMLVKTITAFTVAHSITLTLATFGWVTLPSTPVEAMVAISIVLLATEIVRMERGRSSLTTQWPWIVAFAFGLLHGFGFADALVSLGLPRADIPLALVSFNIGVEIGQLLFIAALLFGAQCIRRIFGMPRQAVVASAYAIGIVAAFWSIERLDSIFL